MVLGQPQQRAVLHHRRPQPLGPRRPRRTALESGDRKTTDETKLLAILEAKKKDPKQMKKTGFAARLEAMQKQQEQLQQQKQNKR